MSKVFKRQRWKWILRLENKTTETKCIPKTDKRTFPGLKTASPALSALWSRVVSFWLSTCFVLVLAVCVFVFSGCPCSPSHAPSTPLPATVNNPTPLHPLPSSSNGLQLGGLTWCGCVVLAVYLFMVLGVWVSVRIFGVLVGLWWGPVEHLYVSLEIRHLVL